MEDPASISEVRREQLANARLKAVEARRAKAAERRALKAREKAVLERQQQEKLQTLAEEERRLGLVNSSTEPLAPTGTPEPEAPAPEPEAPPPEPEAPVSEPQAPAPKPKSSDTKPKPPKPQAPPPDPESPKIPPLKEPKRARTRRDASRRKRYILYSESSESSGDDVAPARPSRSDDIVEDYAKMYDAWVTAEQRRAIAERMQRREAMYSKMFPS